MGNVQFWVPCAAASRPAARSPSRGTVPALGGSRFEFFELVLSLKTDKRLGFKGNSVSANSVTTLIRRNNWYHDDPWRGESRMNLLYRGRVRQVGLVKQCHPSSSKVKNPKNLLESKSAQPLFSFRHPNMKPTPETLESSWQRYLAGYLRAFRKRSICKRPIYVCLGFALTCKSLSGELLVAGIDATKLRVRHPLQRIQVLRASTTSLLVTFSGEFTDPIQELAFFLTNSDHKSSSRKTHAPHYHRHFRKSQEISCKIMV